ncbi:Hypothetical protein NTJ_02980 [Nesidiocoris tenuis]|uniref:Uncharacterized protein n=2 Tax=Nesidiocoris tenuis TaxID=355587 RepID=A0ABN7AIL3_9HEMI|nr:Hypothetical protein NTJ_02980 [Nesidiocoris tenuis]
MKARESRKRRTRRRKNAARPLGARTRPAATSSLRIVSARSRHYLTLAFVPCDNKTLPHCYQPTSRFVGRLEYGDRGRRCAYAGVPLPWTS